MLLVHMKLTHKLLNDCGTTLIILGHVCVLVGEWSNLMAITCVEIQPNAMQTTCFLHQSIQGPLALFLLHMYGNLYYQTCYCLGIRIVFQNIPCHKVFSHAPRANGLQPISLSRTEHFPTVGASPNHHRYGIISFSEKHNILVLLVCVRQRSFET